GAWIESRFSGEWGAVTNQVPNGFETYARVFHPATAFHPGSDPAWSKVRWAEVAEACGATAHRQMQWHAIASGWRGNGPLTGSMDIDDLDALCEILAEHAADPDHTFFGLCTIELWEESFTREELAAHPFLRLPLGRDHIILAGPLSAVDQLDN